MNDRFSIQLFEGKKVRIIWENHNETNTNEDEYNDNDEARASGDEQ
jgi:hypothetical protein